MKFAIIAAGDGSRLANEGVAIPKPLVRINNEPMIDRLIRIFIANNASSISIIVNKEMDEVYEHVCNLKPSVPLHIIHKSTPSSMHSFYELSHTLGNDRFCLTTVDTIFREDEFAQYINSFIKSETDGLMAVTSYIDDEKPLYVETGDNMIIKGFHDENTHRFGYISGGIYCLNEKSIPVLISSIEEKMSRMRNYQRKLVERGLNLQAWQFSKIIDVDHREDIGKAESFLRTII